MKKSGMIAAAAVVLLVAEAAWTQEKVTLRQRHVPGDYVTSVNMDMANTTQMDDGKSVTMNMKMLMVCQMNVAKADGGGLKIDLTYKRISQSISGGPTTMSYDSAYPNEQQNQQLAATYKALLDTKLTIMLDADGKVAQVKGLDEMWEGLKDQNPQMQGMVEAMKQQFGEKMFKEMFFAAQQYLPTQPVAKGESWTVNSNMEIPMIGNMDIKNQCVLKDLTKTADGTVAAIDYAGTMTRSQTQSSPSTSPTSMPFRMGKADIEHSGQITMNADSGMLTQMKTELKMVMEMTIEAPEGAAKTMTISSTGTTDTTMKPGIYVPPASMPTSAPTSMPAAPAAAEGVGF